MKRRRGFQQPQQWSTRSLSLLAILFTHSKTVSWLSVQYHKNHSFYLHIPREMSLNFLCYNIDELDVQPCEAHIIHLINTWSGVCTCQFYIRRHKAATRCPHFCDNCKYTQIHISHCCLSFQRTQSSHAQASSWPAITTTRCPMAVKLKLAGRACTSEPGLWGTALPSSLRTSRWNIILTVL